MISFKKHTIPFLSIILTISLVTNSLYSLAPPGLDEIDGIEWSEYNAVVGEKYDMARVRQEGHDHVIVGVNHYNCDDDMLNELYRDRDIVIHEGARHGPFSFLDKIVLGFDTKFARLKHIRANARNKKKEGITQAEHQENQILLGQSLYNTDMHFIKLPIRHFFLLPRFVLYFISAASVITVAVSLLYSVPIFTYTPVMICFLIVGFITPVFIQRNILVWGDDYDYRELIGNFRNLVFATKLIYLETLYDRNLKTISVVGDSHVEGYARFLASEEKRLRAWKKYADDKKLRKIMFRVFDMDKSMDIVQKRLQVGQEGEWGYVCVGNISQMAGVRELLAAQ